jgi:hypothetical protein
MDILRPGDEIIFSNGHVVKLETEFNGGHNSRIFTIKDDPNKVIRIPKWSRKISYIKETQLGQEKLIERGIPITISQNTHNMEYAIVDRLNPNNKSFEDILKNKVTIQQKEEMLNSLKDFAKKTASFSQIGDFKIEQLEYDFEKKVGYFLIGPMNITMHSQFMNLEKLLVPPKLPLIIIFFLNININIINRK